LSDTRGKVRRALGRFLGRAAAVAAEDPASASRTVSERACWLLGLDRQPFRDNAAPHELFADEAITMQLDALLGQLRDGTMLPLLRGEPGSGKTSMLIQLMARPSEHYHFFVVRGSAGLTAERVVIDMLRVLVRPVPDKSSECFRELVRQLRSLVQDGRPAVLVVDDGDAIGDAELERLLQVQDRLRDAVAGGFRMLLAVDPALDLRIPRLSSKQLDAGQVFTANIRPYNRARIEQYIAHRLATAGYSGSLPFSEEELDAIASEAEGLPRSVETAAAARINTNWPD